MIGEAGAAEWPDGTVTDRYHFLHALYRHVLYQRVSAARRVRMHRAIGLREEAGFGARAAEHAAQLAMHFSRGRERSSALEYHQLAAFAALTRQAPHEAVSHCTAALAALAEADDVGERTARELRLVVTRATLHMATRGYAAAETERDYARARSLCAELRGTAEVFPVLRGLLSYHHVRGELGVAHELGDELLAHAAQPDADPYLVVQAQYGHGATLFHEGALAEAAAHLERGRAGYDAAQHPTHARLYGGYDPGVACALWLAWTRALQGDLEAAAAFDREGLALARQLPDVFSLAWACYGAGVSRQLFGDWAGAEALLREAMQLAEEHGFPHVLGMAMAICGWTQLMQGRVADGIALLRRGVATVEDTGAALMRPSYFGMLATADLLEGDRASAARRYDEAIVAAEATGERVHLAPVLIGRSHLLAGGGPGGRSSRATDLAAEESLEQALAVARAQGARLLELRAAVALARHYDKTGRTVEGRSRLREVYDWFASHPVQSPEVAAARELVAR
jgi:predicted ATPase